MCPPSSCVGPSLHLSDRLIISCTTVEFVLHFCKLNPRWHTISLDFEYSSNAFSLSLPVMRSSAKRFLQHFLTNSVLNSFDTCTCASKWCQIGDDKIAGDGPSPNTSRVNLKCWISEFSLSGFLKHKNLSITRSASFISTMTNAFLILAVSRPIVCQQNLTGVSFGPVWDNHSASDHDWVVWLVVSQTLRIMAVRYMMYMFTFFLWPDFLCEDPFPCLIDLRWFGCTLESILGGTP